MGKAGLRLAAMAWAATMLAGGQSALAQDDPDARAQALVEQMTRAEKIRIVHGHYPNIMADKPADVPQSAGYVPGIERLGIPAQRMTDASLGVAAAHQHEHDNTALPSGLAQAASFDPRMAYVAGRTIGSEARTRGFNVMLAGGMNLTREPRAGRNFEYAGEDALLSALMVGQSVAGIQSNDIVATIKHFALNAQDSGRDVINVVMDDATMRESDLLAFQKAIEIADPGAIMCAYNLVNSHYACENAALTSIARDDWGWKGWMMSDWGAVYSTVKAVNSGLDQEMGEELDQWVWYGDMLDRAIDSGAVQEAQLDAMATRILRSYAAHGVLDNPVEAGRQPDLAAHAEVPLAAAHNGIVLLKNEGGILPLVAEARSIAVIGGAAHMGVFSGGGSSQVKPAGIKLLPPPVPAPSFIRAIYLHPSPPLDAIRALSGGAVTFDEGRDVAAAVEAARAADVAVVFASQFTMEGQDAAMALDGNQDALIAAVAAANPNTVVVLETGGAVKMPWLDAVPAVLEAWYPGGRGGEAIADILFGRVDPSGRLPITFPADEAQLPNPVLPGSLLPRGDAIGNTQPEPFDVTYPEGADVGYRWFARTGAEPLFPFGHGLTYTSFDHSGLQVSGGQALTARFTVANTGARAGTDTPQLYVQPPGGQKRLVGWARAALEPGESDSFEIAVDPRFVASFDSAAKEWVLPAGQYVFTLAENATDPGVTATTRLATRRLPVDWRPADPLAVFDAAE